MRSLRRIKSVFVLPSLFAAVIGVTFIPIYFYPKFKEKELREIQRENQRELKNMDIESGKAKQFPNKAKDMFKAVEEWKNK